MSSAGNMSTSQKSKILLSQLRRCGTSQRLKFAFLHSELATIHTRTHARQGHYTFRMLNNTINAETKSIQPDMAVDEAPEPQRRASVTMYDPARDVYNTVADEVAERKVHPSQSQEPRRDEAGTTIGFGPAVGQGTLSRAAGRDSGLSGTETAAVS